jgi:hypothetical protein
MMEKGPATSSLKLLVCLTKMGDLSQHAVAAHLNGGKRPGEPAIFAGS